MNEAFERVRGANELPLFPLPLVLFPGAPLPLHIFEPRYRQMLRDALTGNRLFGVSFFDPETASLSHPPEGHLGCVAEIKDAETLPDGRSNILTFGVIRYRLEEYVDAGEPYLVGRVAFFADEDEDEDLLAAEARRVHQLFYRIAESVRTLSDERGNLPEIPDDIPPEILSFLVAAAMDLENEVKLELLEMRSTNERLQRLHELLSRVVKNYETRARVHKAAKTNGHGGHKIDLG
jgi:Lon protease-like protein